MAFAQQEYSDEQHLKDFELLLAPTPTQHQKFEEDVLKKDNLAFYPETLVEGKL